MSRYFVNFGTTNTGHNRIQNMCIQTFINFNEFDNFDPLKETYSIFVDEEGKFNSKKFV